LTNPTLSTLVLLLATTPLLAKAAPPAQPASVPATSPASATAEPTVEVPFGCGLAFPVSQTHNIGSHVQNDSWAWDFRMPVGTPVVAAMSGVVRMARGDSTTGGCDPSHAAEANYVVIDGPKGYETQYLHFSKVVVKAGDEVQAGQLLGYSGETGWACGAHLHFKVARPVTRGWNNPSVPARLDGYGDPTLESIVASPACKPSEVITASNDVKPDDAKRAPDAHAVEEAAFMQTVAKGASGEAVAPRPEQAKPSPAAALKASAASAANIAVVNAPGR
jgi:murein DD-endopeptidase MepM/ murein hydrolase activator NlpD